MTGSVQIAERLLALKGMATQTSSDATSAREGSQPTQLPFEVIGSWDDPAIVPDAQSLIRRSGAAERLYRESGSHSETSPDKPGQ
jgi:AsmA protein